MSFPRKPNYSKNQINAAGDIIRSHPKDSSKYANALDIINEWRASHEYPMHTFNMTLRRKVAKLDKDAIVAQRLKKLSTIIDKISNREQNMNLSRMQDIGGVRAVVKDIATVTRLQDIYTEPGRFSHKLKSHKNYITSENGGAGPRSSGYRGVHLVYEFRNSRGRQPNSRDWDGLNIEIQLRTSLQHAWATSVEIVGTMRNENLKSGKGNRDWLTLFQYLSSIIALVESSEALPQHRQLRARELFSRTNNLARKLRASDTIRGWVVAMGELSRVKSKDYHYNILTIDTKNKSIVVHGFRKNDLLKASKKLEKLEATQPELQPVLVAAGDLSQLRRAYPNYLLDVTGLMDILDALDKTVVDKLK